MAQKIQNKKELDVPIGLLEEMDDDLLKVLTSKNNTTISTMKDKERKIVEFKSRVLELVEIFLTSNKSPNMFITKLESFMKVVQDFKNVQKQAYIKRVCKLISKAIQKSDILEYLDNIQLCGLTLISYINKCSDTGLNSQFTEVLDIVLRQLHSLKQPQANKIITKIVVQAISLMKKNSNIKSQWVRKQINNYPNTFIAAFKKLIEMCHISEHYDRSRFEYSGIFQSLVDNQKFRDKLISKPKLLSNYTSLIENILTNIEQQKFKKVAIFRKIMLTYVLMKDQVNSETITNLIANFQSEDQNLQAVITKVNSK